MARKPELHHILDSNHRVIRWPTRSALRTLVVAYLASKFTTDQDYSETAVNALLRSWCTFNDPALLRRELYERGYLARTRDGHKYWKLEVAEAEAKMHRNN